MLQESEPRRPPGRPRVGGVVIGRNEGARLGRSLEAAVRDFDVTVYVDSDSSDGSRELAAQKGAIVLHMKTGPFTPSRGRQTGLEELARNHAELEFVHFVDGDCVLQPNWLAVGLEFLEKNPQVGAVFGRRREEDLSRFYNRLMDVDWNHPSGVVMNFGGESLARLKAVLEAGGWASGTINAEDIDLSLRMREKGWLIQRLDEEMGLHDARMTRFGEYWRRSVRAGYGYLEVGLRYRHGPGRFLLNRVVSSGLYGGALPIVTVAGAFLFWPAAAASGLLYLRVFTKMTRFALQREASPGTALGYAALNLVCKTANLVGSTRCLLDFLQGRGRPRDDLIVYRKT